MQDLANRAQVLELLKTCEQQKDQLTVNELEMFSQIQAKYQTADAGSFDDKTCLEVMLRNIGIRNSVNMSKDEATRVIDFKSK